MPFLPPNQQRQSTEGISYYANCSLRKKSYCVIYYNFRHIFIPYINKQRVVITPGDRGDNRLSLHTVKWVNSATESQDLEMQWAGVVHGTRTSSWVLDAVQRRSAADSTVNSRWSSSQRHSILHSTRTNHWRTLLCHPPCLPSPDLTTKGVTAITTYAIYLCALKN